MKKVNRRLTKMSKRLVAIISVLAITLGCFAPAIKILAETFGSGDYGVSFDLENKNEFIVNSVTINGNTWTSGTDQYRSSNDTYQIVISIDKKGDDIPDIGWGGNWNNLITKTSTNDGDTYTYTLTVNNQNHENFIGLHTQIQQQNNNNNDNNDQEQGNEPHFDGRAYVIWSCGNGTCYHYFDNIPGFDNGNSTFYKNTDVTADNNTSIVFDVDARYKGWALKADFDRWVNAYKQKYNVSEVDWANVDPEGIVGNPPDMREWEDAAIKAGACTTNNTPYDVFQACVDGYYMQESGNLPFIKLQPVGEPEDKNAYVSYGDRNFKVVIYNDDFKGVTMGDLSDLSYYPSSWANPFVMRDQFDISGSTKDKPALMDSILLENTVKIKALNYNSFAISSIEALDVPSDAVTITKDNNGDFRLVFSSNFYDNVVFKVKDTNGQESYIQVKRYTIDGWIGHDNNHPVLIADFYFDRNRSYTDFDLKAKIIYKDGITKKVGLTAKFGVDDGMGNVTPAYESDEQAPLFGPAGKGLKKSTFVYELEDGEDNKIQDVYLTAEYKGSTDTNYAGAYVGSGAGVLANIYHGEEN